MRGGGSTRIRGAAASLSVSAPDRVEPRAPRRSRPRRARRAGIAGWRGRSRWRKPSSSSTAGLARRHGTPENRPVHLRSRGGDAAERGGEAAASASDQAGDSMAARSPRACATGSSMETPRPATASARFSRSARAAAAGVEAARGEAIPPATAGSSAALTWSDRKAAGWSARTPGHDRRG